MLAFPSLTLKQLVELEASVADESADSCDGTAASSDTVTAPTVPDEVASLQPAGAEFSETIETS